MALSTYEIEKRELQRELDGFLAKPSLTATERKQCDVLLGKLKDLRSDEERIAKSNQLAKEYGWEEIKPVSDEQRTKAADLESFRRYMALGETRTYSGLGTDNTGAYIVPAAFYNKLLIGISQYTELLSRDNVNLIETDTARILTVPEIDLSTITSSIVAENTDAPPVANPDITSNVLKGYSYKTNPIVASFELEQDSFESITDILTAAFAVGLARGMGSDLVNGSGTGAPKGILAAAADSTVVAASTSVFTKAELQALYFSVNRAYRVSPKAAWLMNDTTYNAILSLKDSTTNRPLVNITEDTERLFGKRILVSPDMPTAAGSKAIAFGDFGQYNVRLIKSGVLFRRNTEAPGYVERGSSLYTCYARMDANLNAAASGSVKYATLHA